MPHTYRHTVGAAQRVGLSGVTFERYRIQGCGPRYAKLGKRVVYRDDDVDEWVASRLIRSTSEEAA